MKFPKLSGGYVFALLWGTGILLIILLKLYVFK